jgi:nicotinate (nicotinamide) nucleotide adenylyltransferase
MAPFAHRLKMCELAIEARREAASGVKACDYEFKHNLRAESFEIVSRLITEYSATFQFSFVIGLDNAHKIHTWSKWQDLISLLPFIVVPRVIASPSPCATESASSLAPVPTTSSSPSAAAAVHVPELPVCEAKTMERSSWFNVAPHVHLDTYAPNKISSTAAREALRTEKVARPDHLLDDPVMAYIAKHALYTSSVGKG